MLLLWRPCVAAAVVCASCRRAARRRGLKRKRIQRKQGEKTGERGLRLRASPGTLLTPERRVLPKGVLVQRVPLAAGGHVFRAADLWKRGGGAVLLIAGNFEKVALQRWPGRVG